MKLEMVLTGPKGKMWDFTMNYHGLPPAYEVEIASVARSLVSYISNVGGAASANDIPYEMKFSYGGAGQPKDKPLPPEYESLFSGIAEAGNLLYSQVVDIQDAGIALLGKLMDGAHMEIKSGQRQ